MKTRKFYSLCIVVSLLQFQLLTAQTDEVTFPRVQYDFGKAPRTQLSSMSIKLFDDYATHRPEGIPPGNNNYGTLLAINGYQNHWENDLYFGASTNKLYFRTSTWTGATAEDGTQGGFNDWRTVLDSKSNVESNGLLRLTGDGEHYLQNGKLGIGVLNPEEKVEVNGNVLANQYRFKPVYYDFSASPRTQVDNMSIKLFDDYYSLRPGGTSPDNNDYGTLLAIYGRSNHWESNIYIGANTKRMYFRTSTWAGATAEDGTKGGFHEWRKILDSKSPVETTGNLKISGEGVHYISNGNVGIGCTAPDEKLVVNGTIKASEIKVVNTSALPCSDYVFESGYNLRSLEEVESFVKENKHLPEVPSAAEFKENGYSIGEMDDVLLRKIEELTLYMIELKKQNEQLQKEVRELKNK